MVSAEDQRLLILKRGQVKAKLTRILNALNAAKQKNERPPLPQLRVYAKQLSTIYQEYNDVHDMVIAAVPEENVAAQEEKYVEFEDQFNVTSTEIETMIESIEKENRAPSPIPTTSAAGAVNHQPPVIVQSQSYRAPLPTFDGRYEAWPRFKAMFQDLMQRSHDSDAVKLYHLENSLKGDAAGVIDLETLQNNNYQRAWDVLEERFGNKRLILESHILGILNLKKMTKKSSKDLRNLVDECTRHVENLIKLNQPLSGMSELLVVTVLTRALDDQTRELWEASIDQTELPEYEPTIEFLKQRCVILERCEKSVPAPPSSTKVSNQRPPAVKIVPSKSSHAASVTSEYACDFCSGQHLNYKCSAFLKLAIQQRQAKVKEANMCFNCLRKGHRSASCPSDKSCGKCSKKHHTLLHFEQREKPEVKPSEVPKLQEIKPVPAVIEPPLQTSCSSSVSPPGKQVFLMTAMVNLTAKNGQVHRVRALLDSGSQINIIAESVVQRLKLPKQPATIPVIGVGGHRSKLHHKVVVHMASNCSDFAVNVECHTAPKVTGTIPSVRVNIDSWNIPPGILLADASFYCPNEIEMLIGAELFFDVLKQGQIKLSNSLPTLYETQFGWVVAGTYSQQEDDQLVCANVAVKDELEECLKRFFDQEEIVEANSVTTEEQRFEEHFQRTYRRDKDGRFVVHLPFRDNVNQLGSSRSLALKRFLLLEKRLARQPDLQSQYSKFIEEYQALGHCREIKEEEDPPGIQTYYLPHHCVLKPSSSSTKLRVVFDATAKTVGLSLNDVLMTGPNSQSDLFTIVMRFRTHPIVFSADVSKMYRQVLVDPSQTRYQRIFWRNHPSETLKTFELLTVTYGTSAASFLAVRSLIQLARDESDMVNVNVKLWSDSTIVLAWLNKPLDRLEVYVRNRVAKINQLTDRDQWSYVNTSHNPADIVSRGMKPAMLKQSSLWWNGPAFLAAAAYEMDIAEDLPESKIPELKKAVVASPAVRNYSEPVFEWFSSFNKLQRVLAQVARFVRLVRTPKDQRGSSSELTLQDMRRAEIFIVRHLQQSELREEFQSIQRGDLPKRIANLQPFIDNEGLLRVGGRLQKSKLPFEAKHQLFLPRKHRLTEMLIRKYHEERLHEGQSGVLAAIRQKFWLTNARSAIRKVIHDCVKCFRTKPRSIQPLMGVLPEARVTENAPFELTGVDYAGPIFVKEGRHKPKVVKAYISLFVCLTTKAIHLELVSDLTTEAFLAALDRFINRRGLVRKMFSDNGTNFVGAKKELRHLRDLFNDQVERKRINDFLIHREVEWEFIPPRSPNFGGLWEAGVKVVKSHLIRTLGTTTLTFEQFTTVLTHIEAIVNSRPLYPTSDDPNDPQPISPANLLLGRPLEPVTKPSYLDVPANRLTKWQYLNQLRENFWRKWSREYLSTLQARAKWTKKQPNVKIDTIVLLAEENQPPQAWKLGRIIAVYPGNDGIVRVADVQTATGVYRRAVSKMAPLPLQDNVEQQP